LARAEATFALFNSVLATLPMPLPATAANHVLTAMLALLAPSDASLRQSDACSRMRVCQFRDDR
jgi:hypothetical protein